MQNTHSYTPAERTARAKLSASFFKKGVILATLSGIFYGLYTAFVTLAMSTGVWGDWYGYNVAMLSAFTITFTIGALGSAINYTLSSVWGLGIAGFKGKVGEVWRSFNSKPGRILTIAALIGGPISTAAYVIGLQLAGSIIVPIAALCPAVGTLLGKIFYKQHINKRMVFGLFVCFLAALLIGVQAIEPDAPPQMLLGIGIAFIAAVGWGFEGVVGGRATVMIDYEIGIVIRQVVSGLAGLVILFPLFALLGNMIDPDGVSAMQLFVDALTDGPAMLFFFVSSFFALYAFSLWYKGNAMCGTALGMALNGAFSFWGPFFCWIVLGLVVGQEGWDLSGLSWFAAVLMFVGILFIATNPMELFKKKEVA